MIKKVICYVINNPDKKYLIEFGKNLRKLRLGKKLTQDELGDLAVLGKNQVGRIERGEINVTLSTIKKLAENLGKNPKDLFDF